MITLRQFPPALGLPNASPFCLKLELYLRMAGLPYRNRYTLELHRAPKGKLPWIDDDGIAMADSGLIIVPRLARRGIRAELQGHGMGRHTPAHGAAIFSRRLSPRQVKK